MCKYIAVFFKIIFQFPSPHSFAPLIKFANLEPGYFSNPARVIHLYRVIVAVILLHIDWFHVIAYRLLNSIYFCMIVCNVCRSVRLSTFWITILLTYLLIYAGGHQPMNDLNMMTRLSAYGGYAQLYSDASLNPFIANFPESGKLGFSWNCRTNRALMG